jgi:hypothetical protein
LYHKEPTRSSVFVKSDFWQRVGNLNLDMLLMHARAASQGYGSPKINRNNHPFVNANKEVALIHNGRIPDVEYRAYQKKYELLTNCDSELYLRIFESNADRLAALQTLWSHLRRSHMAIGIGEWLSPDERRMWLFRNEYRSLWMADLRESLGQIFFFSTEQIWDEATWECTDAYPYLSKVKYIQLPVDQIWSFRISKDKPVVDDESFDVYQVKSTGNQSPWNFDGTQVAIPARSGQHSLITGLDEFEDVIVEKEKENLEYAPLNDHTDLEFDLFPDMDDPKKRVMELAALCTEAKACIDDVEIGSENLIMEGSMTPDQYREVVNSLEAAMLEIQGTIRILDSLH